MKNVYVGKPEKCLNGVTFGEKVYYFVHAGLYYVLLSVVGILSMSMISESDLYKLVSYIWVVDHRDTVSVKNGKQVITHSKLDQIQSISTCVLDNFLCACRMALKKCICAHCYASSQQKRNQGLTEHNIINGLILKNVIIPVHVFKLLPLFREVIRIESFGDVENVTQAINYIHIIKAFPEKRFGIWSKNIGLWACAFKVEGKPDNCTYVHSSREVNKPDSDVLTRYDFVDHVFTVYDKDYAKAHNIMINCGGRKCMECIIRKCNCYFRDGITFINELLK